MRVIARCVRSSGTTTCCKLVHVEAQLVVPSLQESRNCLGHALGLKIPNRSRATPAVKLSPKMTKRNLRVLKWLAATPAIGVCTSCAREFKVPMSALTRTADAQANLQEQFDRHKCEGRDSAKERKTA